MKELNTSKHKGIRPAIIKASLDIYGIAQSIALFTPFHKTVLHRLTNLRPYITGVSDIKPDYHLDTYENTKVQHVKYMHSKIRKKTDIMLISDIHSDIKNKLEDQHLASLLKYAKETQPDIILVLGDIVHKRGKLNNHVKAFLKDASHVSKLRYLWGNHDHYATVDIKGIAQQLDVSGIKSIYSSPLKVNNIAITGFDYPQFMTLQQQNNHLDHFSKDSFNLLAIHSPDLIDSRHAQDLADIGIDCMVHGHTHWGEIFYIGILRPMIAHGYLHLNSHMAKAKFLINHRDKPMLSINNRGSSIALERILTTSFEPKHPWIQKFHQALVLAARLISWPRICTHLVLEPQTT